MNSSDRPRTTVERFRLAVLGGTFAVAEALPAPGHTPPQAVASVHAEPAARRLRMAAAERAEDALALIDGSFGCRIAALGGLQPKPS